MNLLLKKNNNKNKQQESGVSNMAGESTDWCQNNLLILNFNL